MRLEAETVMVTPRVPVVGDWGGGIKKEAVQEVLAASLRREDDWGNGDRDPNHPSCDQRKLQICPCPSPSPCPVTTTSSNHHNHMVGSSPQQKLVVGYALTSKKIKSFMQPKLEGLARKKGITFVPIDRNRPLDEQGPFDVVLHKLSGKDWRQNLEDYRKRHPEAIVLDPPDAIQHLYNRQSMLQDVADLDLSDREGKVGVPKQLVITGDPASIPSAVAKAGLKLPLVAKPLVVDGTAKSHALSLAYDQFSLAELDPPLVLQEFVNHGGVLFKVYIVGETIKVVRRFSLPDLDESESLGYGVMPFPRVSNAAASADDADLDPNIAELPPFSLLDKLATELRRRLGLRLFNLDIIREHGTRDSYYVIDINYFPGYGKMPGYEYIFTDFLLRLVQGKQRKLSGAGVCAVDSNDS
uniref:Inositol-tetrakisphosphate 1-kinase n=1 Tax=Araucaria cunninghamii TaxID=56994 RepID=A0A0D6QTZ2_ARACU